MRFVFLALAVFFLFAWFGAFIVFHIAGAMIHLLLLLAIFSLVVHLFSGRKAA